MKKEEISTSDFEIGLSKVIGKKIKEVHGYISGDEDEGQHFQMTKVEFEDGTWMWAEGEHDMPYLWTEDGKVQRKISQAAKSTKDEE